MIVILLKSVRFFPLFTLTTFLLSGTGMPAFAEIAPASWDKKLN